MTLKEYLFSNNLETKAIVVEIGFDKTPFLILDKTLFHAQGGGQKADRGFINDIPVTHVAHSENGTVRHYIQQSDGFVINQQVPIVVDASWRSTNSALHTVGHLIASLGQILFPSITAVGGHHWPNESRVEFIGETFPDLNFLKDAISNEIEKLILKNTPVFIVGNPISSRAIQIGDFSAIPCGGTHLTNLNQLQTVTLTNIKVKGNRLRVSYNIDNDPKFNFERLLKHFPTLLV